MISETAKRWTVWAIGVILVTLAGIWLINYVTAESKARQESEQQILVLKEQLKQVESEKAKLLAKAEEQEARANQWGAVAMEALKKVSAMDARVRDLDQRLAALGPMKPVTDPTTIPNDQGTLLARYKADGLDPLPEPKAGELAFSLATARPMLALVEDGKEYPKALQAVNVLTEQTGILKDQVHTQAYAIGALQGESAELRGALNSTKSALGECEKAGAIKAEIIDAKDAIIKETQKDATKTKWRWGIKGAVGGSIVGALIVLLL